MNVRWISSLFMSSVALLCCWAQTAQTDKASRNEGGITGLVLTSDGEPARGAKPCTLARSGNNTTINCRGIVDVDGRFTIEHLSVGTYQVFAINEAEGYSIENQTPGQEIAIVADQPWPNVTVRLGKRGGILVGSITDRFTGKPIKGQILYTAVDRNGDGGSMFVDGQFNVVVPPDCDVLVVAMAKGYKCWIYADGVSPRPVLRLASGERKLVNIQLEPLPSDAH